MAVLEKSEDQEAQELREWLRKEFQKSPYNFAIYFMPQWMKYQIPKFHFELYRLMLENRLCVRAPRYFSKSKLFSQIYPMWAAITERKKDIIIVSATESIAKEQLMYIKQQFEGNQTLLANLGDMRTDKWTEDEIRLKNGARIRAKGRFFQLRGLHPDCIILDDIEGDHLDSELQQDKLDDWFDTTLMGTLSPVDQCIVVGTVIHPSSFMRRFEGRLGWTQRTYRALDEQGNSIWKERWPTEKLLEIRSRNEMAFEQEYMNNPLRSGQTVFREEWLQQKVPFPPPVTEVVFTAVDPAISKKESADYTAIVTFGVQGNLIYELESKQGRWSMEETIQQISQTYQIWMPMMIGVEDVAYQKALIEVLNRQTHPWTIQPIKADKDKRRRALAVTGFFQRGQVHLSNPDLLGQLKLFTGTPTDSQDDLCFSAGTKVETLFGSKSIEKIIKGELVLCPSGFKKVIFSGQTGFGKTITNFGLKGTPGHKVFADSSLTQLDTLVYGMHTSPCEKKEFFQWGYRKLLSSLESPTDSWGRDGIILASQRKLLNENILKDFMWRCGSMLTKRMFLKAMKFITKTAILLITRQTIWTVYRLSCTARCLRESTEKRFGRIWNEFVLLQKFGIVLSRVGSGIESMQEKFGRVLQGIIPSYAVSAENCLSLSGRIHSFAPLIAKPSIGERKKDLRLKRTALFAPKDSLPTPLEINQSAPLLAEHDSDTSEEPLYNLTVEGDGMYYANGLLVSNCDAAVHCLHMIQLYCWPNEEPVVDSRTNLSVKDRRVWDQLHVAEEKTQELRGVRVDSYLGSEW